MARKALRSGALVLIIAFALAPAPSEAIAPLLLMMIKQFAQQAATSMIKDALLSSLSGMGCKGIALSNALTALDLRGGSPAMLGGALSGAPGGLMGGALGGVPTMPAGAGMAMGGIPQGAGIPADMAASLSAMMANSGQVPEGMELDPEQAAMLSEVRQSMSEPLSPPETLATIDELFELGLLPQAMQAELKECMVLVPATIPTLGTGMAMIQPMIPQFRQAREELQALSPDEQDEIADLLAQEVRALPADQAAELMESIDGGFFPVRVSEGVKAQLSQ